MNSPTRQHERHMEEVARTKSEAESRNSSGKVAQAISNAEYEEDLSARLDDAMFSDMSQTESQELLHELGGGISKGPPRGGWPVFDPVSGKRLASPRVSTSHFPQ